MAAERESAQGKRRTALAALLLGATCIGVAPILVRWSEVGPSATAGWRVLLALPFLWIWSKREQRKASNSTKLTGRSLVLCAAAGIFFAGDLGFWHWSLKFTTVANSTLFTNTAPFFVTAAAHFLFGERIGWTLVSGLGLAFAGGALLASESFELSASYLLGDSLAVIAAFFYAGYLLTLKRLRRSYNTARIMTYSAMASIPVFFLAAVVSVESILPGTLNGWGVLLALALISHIGGQCLIAFSLAHLPASFSSVTLLWQPVVAAFLAALLLGEGFTVRRVLGGIIVLAGIAVAGGLWSSRKSEPAESTVP